MNAGAYVVAAVCVVLVVGGFSAAGIAVRRRLIADLEGPDAVLAACVLALSMLFVAAWILGAVGELRRLPLLGVAVVAGGTGLCTLVRAPAQERRRGARVPRGCPSAEAVVSVGAVAVVCAQWLSRTVAALQHGITDYDSLHYHLSHAARFAQTGSVFPLYFTTPDAPVAFHPSNAELLHGIGMVVTGRDVLSPVVNLGWLALALLAAWCVGRTRRVPHLALLLMAVVAGLPVVAASQAGTAQNDLAGLALVVAALALIEKSPRALAVAGLAAGLALGTKLTLIVPVGALAVALLWAERRRVVRAVLPFAVPIAVTGSAWYLRNLAATGSPAPAADIHLGPLSLPSTNSLIANRYGFSVAHYLTDGHVWRHWLLPGLRQAFGTLWPVLLALVGGGIAFGARGPRVTRVAAFAAAASVVAYLVTPTTALGFEGQPLYFGPNLRYATPALATALLALALVLPSFRGMRPRMVAIGVAVAVLAAAELAPQAWPDDHRAVAIACSLTAVVAVALALTLRSHVTAVVVLVVVAVVAMVGFFPVQRAYLRDRYTHDAVHLWARRLSGERIAIVGFDTAYPLFGDRFQNRVQYVGHRGPHGEFTVVRSCGEWRRLLREGRYRFVVVGQVLQVEYDSHEPPEAQWTRSIPRTVEVLRDGTMSVLRVGSPPDRAGC